MKCTACTRLVASQLANPAIARWVGPDGSFHFVCTQHLDGWLDHADNDPTWEPAAVDFLVTTALNTTVEDELALAIGSALQAGVTPLGIARGLLQSGWMPPPAAGLEGMALIRG